MKLERHVARHDAAGFEAGGGLLKQRHAAAERAAEAFLLLAQGLDDQRAGAHQLGIGRAHFVDQGRGQAVHQRISGAEDVGVAHGPAHDPAQNIAAALVRGRDAVGDQERRRAQMVGDDPMRRRSLALGFHAGQLDAGGDQGLEQVDVIVGMHALQDGGQPLQPHAGVDRGFG